jgi:hypothetical protein
MSDKSRELSLQSLRSEKGSAAAGAVAGIAAIIGGLYMIDKALPPTSGERAKTELKNFETAITSGQSVGVLENGAAKVELQDDGKFANIVNPIVTSRGHVIGRDKFSGQVIVYYKESNSTDEKYAAKGITYTEDGKAVSKEQAIHDSKPLVLETPQKVNGHEFAYVAADGQGFSNQPIAVDTPEKSVTTTITKVVPDKG